MATDRTGEILKGKYRLIRQVGRGGFADVWLARDVDYLRREVAVKILHQRLTKDEDNVRRFFNEAKLVGSINARNIVRVSDYGVSNGHHFLVMEYLQGPTLRKSLKERLAGVIACSEALSIIEQICDGLAIAANTYSVAHRDLKPENIFLSHTRSEVYVTIVDFGIAKIVDEQALSSFASGPMTTGVIGTPIYMAPELTKRLIGDEFPAAMYFQADIYSLGVMLYEMLTGSPPFEGPDAEVLRQHLAVMPMRPRQVHPELDLPESVEGLVMRCLEKSPHKRYQNAEELGEAIRSLHTEDAADELEAATTRPRSLPSTSSAVIVGQGAALGGTKPIEIMPPVREIEEGTPRVPSRKAMRQQSRAAVAYAPAPSLAGSRKLAAAAQVIQLHSPKSERQVVQERAVNRRTEDQGVVFESCSSTTRERIRTSVYIRPLRLPMFTKIVISSTLVTALVSMCTIGSAILVFSSSEIQESIFSQLRARRERSHARGGANRGGEGGLLTVRRKSAAAYAINPGRPGRNWGTISGHEEEFEIAVPTDAIVLSAFRRELLAPHVSEDPAGKTAASETAVRQGSQTSSGPKKRRPRPAQTMASEAAKIQAVVLANCTIRASRDLETGSYPVFFFVDISSGKPTNVVSGAPKNYLDDEDCVLRYAKSKVNFKDASDIATNFEYTYKVRTLPGSAALNE